MNTTPLPELPPAPVLLPSVPSASSEIESLIATCFADSDISYCPIERNGVVEGGMIIVRGESTYQIAKTLVHHSIEVANAKQKA